jgi:membrane protease YdiL (CAAX protease family)
MDAPLYSLTLAAITFAAFLLLKSFDKRLTFVFGVLFALYMGLDDLATGLPSAVSAVRLIQAGDWNWSGKLYSLVLASVVILGLRIKPESVGLTLPTRNIRWCALALIPLIAVGVALGLIFKPDSPTAETLAFQLLMPGLAEEIAYRGIAPALLLGLIRGKEPAQDIPWAVICIAAVPFAIEHGLGLSSRDGFSFDLAQTLYIGSGAIIYGWMRFASGSLLFPLLGHSLANVAFQLTAM